MDCEGLTDFPAAMEEASAKMRIGADMLSVHATKMAISMNEGAKPAKASFIKCQIITQRIAERMLAELVECTHVNIPTQYLSRTVDIYAISRMSL